MNKRHYVLVYQMVQWKVLIESQKTLKEIHEDFLILIIHVIVFFDLQEKILLYLSHQNLKNKYIAITVNIGNHIRTKITIHNK